jgi:hypothetical protein
MSLTIEFTLPGREWMAFLAIATVLRFEWLSRLYDVKLCYGSTAIALNAKLMWNYGSQGTQG